MDDLSTCIVVVLLGDPVTGEGGEGAESGGTAPHRVVSIWGSNNLGHTLLRCFLLNLVVESGINTLVKSGSTREDDVGIEVSSHIDITVVDRLDGKFGQTESLITLLGEGWFEDKLGGFESWSVDIDNLAIRKLEVLYVLVRSSSLLKGLLVILSNKASPLLDSSNNLLPGTSPTLSSNSIKGQKLLHILGDSSSSDEVLANSVRNGETFENWDGVGDTISRVANETGGTAVGVKGHDSLDGNVKTIAVKLLEHDLGHLFSICLGVTRSLSQKDVVLGGIATELVVESVLPDLVHVVPVGNNTRLDGVVELEDTSHLLGFVTNVFRLLINTDHSFTSGDTDDGRELNGRLSLFRETGLEDTGSVINYYVFVSHFVVFVDGVF